MPVLQDVKRRSRKGYWIAAGFGVIGVAHIVVGNATHAQHLVHLVFGAAYLLPIVAAAAWLGARPALLLSAASAATYLLHARTVRNGEPMGMGNALVLSAVFLFVGAVSATLVAAAERERRARLEGERSAQRDAMMQALASLSGALRQRDDGTAAHCERVAGIAIRVGAAIGLPVERLQVLHLAALVHDVGKIGVRDDILLKPGALTLDERARIERHTILAAEILRPIRGAEEIAEIVLCHHECPDGSGYPRGLQGDRIPALAGVLRVADVFAALVEPRTYKAPMRPEEAVARMRSLEGRLDPVGFAALRRMVAADTPHGLA
jgi:putative nucleotidyltransferase with HDIG domain